MVLTLQKHISFQNMEEIVHLNTDMPNLKAMFGNCLVSRILVKRTGSWSTTGKAIQKPLTIYFSLLKHISKGLILSPILSEMSSALTFFRGKPVVGDWLLSIFTFFPRLEFFENIYLIYN